MKLLFAISSLLFLPAAHATPTGGQVVAGSSVITTPAAGQTQITQATDRSIINWQSYNIAPGESVRYIQPSATAISLNRVVGADPTAIHGQLSANGRVWVINPNGLLVGADASVNVGGFLGSTLGLADQDFLAANHRFTAGSRAGAVSNLGTITTPDGGYVMLIAPSVANAGTIATPQGKTYLAAGGEVTLSFAGNDLLGFTVGSGGVAEATVANSGRISAAGGEVILSAQSADRLLKGVVNNTGVIEARTVANHGGRIFLLGDMQGGAVNVAGTLDASAPAGGDGGFVETSAATVDIAADTRVTAGHWLIDPTDITIDSAKATAINSALGGGDVTVTTADSGNNSGWSGGINPAGGTAPGNITVAAPITWNGYILTLRADNDILINAPLTSTGDTHLDGLVLQYAQTTGTGSYVVNAPVNLKAGSRFQTQHAGDAAITWTVLTSLGAAGSTTATDLQGMNGNHAGYYVLGADIDASATATWNVGDHDNDVTTPDQAMGFAPVGRGGDEFQGVFDGLGHVISGLTINRPTTDNIGLFGNIENATLRHVGLDGGSITGDNQVGALVGWETSNNSNISRVWATSAVTGKSDVGGLVGWFLIGGTLSHAWASGDVSGTGNVGGLVGTSGNVTFSDVWASGKVTGSSSLIGGLVGSAGSSTIARAYATGDVSGSSRVGGLVGGSSGDIRWAWASGRVTGTVGLTGGLVGVGNASVTQSYATGEVTGGAGASNVGGLFGSHGSAPLTATYWNTDANPGLPGVGSDAAATGVTGLTLAQLTTALPAGFDPALWANAGNHSAPYVSSFNRPQVLIEGGGTDLYGLIRNVDELQAMQGDLSGRYALGNDLNASVTAGWNSGAGFEPIGTDAFTAAFSGVFDGLGHTISGLTINRPATMAVGLFGYLNLGTVRNVTLAGGGILGDSYVGALVGFEGGDGVIAHSRVIDFSVTGAAQVGGLVGGTGYNASINDSHVVGTTVSASGNDVGGLVGSAPGQHQVSASSVSGGSVTGAGTNVGGLLGLSAYGDISHSIAATPVSSTGAGAAIGGLIGRSLNNYSVSGSAATGAVSGTGAGALLGGLIGLAQSNPSTVVANTYATGAVSGTGDNAVVGGLIGRVQGVTLSASYATGAVTGGGGTPVLGALVGQRDLPSSPTPSVFTDTYWSTDSGAVAGVGAGDVTGVTGLTVAELLATLPAGFDPALWSTAGNQTTPWLAALPHNTVFTVNDPAHLHEVIRDADELQAMNRNVAGRYVLGHDIDATATATWNAGDHDNDPGTPDQPMGFAPVGGSGNYFSGVFDGLGYVISGLTINRPATYAVGLFGITYNANLRNVGLDGGSITGFGAVGSLLGSDGFSDNNVDIISRVWATSTVSGGDRVGGLIGISNRTVNEVWASGDVSGVNYVGGLVGFGGPLLTDAHASGKVTGTGDRVGGLMGWMLGGRAINVYATGEVSGVNYVGGLVGYSVMVLRNTWASGKVTGTGNYVGGLTGLNSINITQSYATGEVTGGGDQVGGLIGRDIAGNILQSYATGKVTGGGPNTGGLIGFYNNAGTFTDTFWNTSANGALNGAGNAAVAGVTGKTLAEMQQLSTYAAWGADISGRGGESTVWRLYEGFTTPLLRSFLTPLTLTPDYDGSGALLADIGSHTLPGGADATLIKGPGGLILSSTAADAYAATLGLYSTQTGYDLTLDRVIATPGSTAGDIRLAHGVAWTNGALVLDTAGSITTSAAIAGGTGSTFILRNGAWSQNGASLPGFAVNDFRLDGGSFLRVAAGDGSIFAPYEIFDLYGLQGLAITALDKNFMLTADIAAGGTASWNDVDGAGGADPLGFRPIGSDAVKFIGSFDGQGHVISGLTINRPAETGVGLFGVTQGASLRSLSLTGVNVRGSDSVGALAGLATQNNSISYVSAGGDVQGGAAVGGLVGKNTNNQIIWSYATANVTGSDYVGGLVGENTNGQIIQSYATGNVTGYYSVGGLIGLNNNSVAISQVYATGAVTGNMSVGGLVGLNLTNTSINHAYATGAVTGNIGVGGLIGELYGTGGVINSFYATTAAAGAAINNGGNTDGAYDGNTYGTAKSYADLTRLATFSAWGADIDAAGGTAAAWRIYDGQTTPLIRGLLTPLTLDLAYTGTGAPLADITGYTLPGGVDATQIKGAATGGLVLSSTAADGYTATLTGLYSTQTGYDLTTHRTIATPGSAAGDIALAGNALTWTTGTLIFDTTGTITTNAAVAGGAGSTFILRNGTWSQNAASLPGFAVNDFRLDGGIFLRVLGGDGDAAAGGAYQVADIYGLQGMKNFLAADITLANDIAAAGTANWNDLDGAGGADPLGFAPIGPGYPNYFTGVFDGLGHVISGLTINRPAATYVGLFGITSDANLRNVGLDGGSITGLTYVGSLVGAGDDNIFSRVWATSTVTGLGDRVGGLMGEDSGNSTMNEVWASGEVSGVNYVGGLVGFGGPRITDGHASGKVTGVDRVGGLIGWAFGGRSSNVYATGEVSGVNYVGGLVGSSTMLLFNTWASGKVTGTGNQVGGLAGQTAGNITRSYATGEVTGGGDQVGGLLGRADGVILQSYATGKVTGGGANTGGLVGFNNTGTFTDTFWNTSANGALNGVGNAAVAGVTGKTLAEMQQLSTYAAWGADISDRGGESSVWRIYEGKTTPLLRGFLTPLTITAADATKTYDGLAYTGGNGVTYSAPPDASLLGAATYGGTAQGAINAGPYTLAPGGFHSTQQGYDISYASGALTVNQAALTITAADATKTYDGTAYAGGNGVTYTGFVNSETDAVLGGTLAYGGTSQGARNAGGYVITPGGLTSGNYALTFANGALTIDPAALTLTTGNVTKTYDGTTSAAGTAAATGGTQLFGTDTLSGGSFAFTDKHAGTGDKTVTVSGVTVSDGNSGQNYTVTYAANTTSTITPAPLTLNAATDSKVYDGTTASSGTVTATTLAPGDTLTGLTQSYAVKDALGANGSTLAVNGGYLLNDGNGGNNYAVTVNTATGTISPAALAVTASDDTRTYDGTAYTGGNGITYTGFVNGETDAVLGGTLAYGGTAQGAVNAGSYVITPGGLTSGNYTLTFTNGALTVDQAALTVTANAAGKTYDGTAYAGGNGVTYTGFVNSETDAVLGGTLAYGGTSQGAKNAGNYVITPGGLTSGNYALTFANGALTIDPAALTLTTGNVTKTYDGTAGAAGTAGATGGTQLFGTDTLSGGAFAFTNPDAGTGKTVTAGGVTVNDGNGGANYTVTYVPNTTSTITPAPLTITANNDARAYDGTAYGGGNGVSYSSFVPGETSAVLGGTLAYGGDAQGAKNAGGYTITPGGLTSGNYTLTFADGTLTISQAGLTLGADGKAKIYGDTDPALTYQFTAGALAPGDSFSGALARDAGENTGGYAIRQGSLTAGSNYVITFANGTLTITPRPVTVSTGNVAKTYDGTTTAAGSVVITGGTLAGTDALDGGVFAFADPDAGANKTVNVSGVTVNDGNGGANYAITHAPNTTSTINPAALAVTANNDARIYDSTAYSGGNGVTYSGFVNSETAAVLGGTLAYGGTAQGAVNAGTYTITPSGLTAGNYTLTFANGALTVDPRPVTVGTGDVTKTYDGTTTAAGSLVLAAGALAGSDTLGGGSFAFADPNAGVNKTVNVSGATVNDGNGGANYAITYAANTASTINPAALAVTANNDTRTYDGTAYTGGNGVTYTGFVNGETDAVLGGALAYGGTAQGAINADSYTIAPSGLTSGNYTLTFNDGTLTIAPAGLTLLGVGADDKMKTYGDADPALTYQLTSGALVAGDSFSGSLVRDAGENVGGYTIRQGTLTAGSNYVINFANGTLTITARPLAVTANNDTRIYDGTAYTGGHGVTYSGFAPGEDSTALGGTLAYGGTSQGAVNAGGYIITPGGLTSGNYTITFNDGALTIAPAGLTLLGVGADDKMKTYGDADPALTYELTSGALVAGDSFSGALVRDAGENVGGYAIRQGTLTAGSNYVISFANGTLTISARPITVGTGNVAKTYDGTTTAAGSLVLAAGTLAGSDTLGGGSFAFTDPNAGVNKTVNVSGATVNDGNGGLNYAITYTPNTTSTINAAALAVTANNDTRTYDGTAYNGGNGVTYTGFVPGETDAVLGGALAYTGDSQGAVNAGSYVITPGGLTAGNYTITFHDGALTITPAGLTLLGVGADDKTKIYGDADPALTWQLASGALAPGDSLTGSLTRDPGENVGDYAIRQGTLTAGSNYTLTFANGTLTITPAALTITADDAGKTYGQTVAFTGSGFTAAGLRHGETIGSVTLASDGAVTSASAGRHAITAGNATGGTFNAGNYTITYANGTLTITPAALAVTADALDKLFASPDPALTYAVTGLQAGDTAAAVLSGALGRAPGETEGLYAINQGTLAANGNYTIGYTGSELTIWPNPLLDTVRGAGLGGVMPGLTNFPEPAGGFLDPGEAGLDESGSTGAGESSSPADAAGVVDVTRVADSSGPADATGEPGRSEEKKRVAFVGRGDRAVLFTVDYASFEERRRRLSMGAGRRE